MNLDDFTKSYIECMFWCGIHDQDEENFNKKSAEYTLEDISPECLEKIIADCKKFQEDNRDLLSLVPQNTQWSPDEMNGHDFFLSRNGHGSGYFCRGYGNIADELQDKSREFGEFNIYIGDDGKVYSL